MKFLILPLLAAALLTSCRTNVPLHPMTMKPCSKCLPGQFTSQTEDCYDCGQVDAAK